MSQPKRPTPPTRTSAREELAARRRAEAAAARRRERALRVGLAVAVILAVVVGGVMLLQRDRSASQEAAKAPVPAGAQGVGGGIVIGPEGVPVLDLWEDFQCPACRDLEASAGATIAQLTEAGKLRVVYHPLSFLDASLNNDSSKRAAAAAGCAADQGAYPRYHNAVYAGQPEKEGTGYTDQQLLDFGRTAGLSGAAYDDFASCVADERYAGWVRQVADTMAANQVTGTPTLKLNGTVLSGQQLTPAGLSDAVVAAS